MAIEVTDIIENEDGSADVQFDVSDEQELKMLVEEGLNFLLLKEAYGLSTSDIVAWAEERKKI